MELRITKAASGRQTLSSGNEGRSLLGLLRQAVARLSDWQDRRRAAAELGGLTDRELADIGLTRGDIGNVVACTTVRQPVAGRLAPGRAPAGRGTALA